MYRALRVAASGMTAQQRLIDVLAHNLANVNTTGFKRSRLFFEELGYQRENLGGVDRAGRARFAEIGMGVRVREVARDMRPGTVEQTGSALDVAIDGDGFLPVLAPDGRELYMRAGRLRIDAEGRLVAANGYELAAGIVVPPEAEEIEIAEDGTVSAWLPDSDGPEVLGRIELVTFPAPDRLEAIGDNLFRAVPAAGRPLTSVPGTDGAGRLLQGALEGSNVDVVEEIIDLIAGQRAYELNSRVLQAVDEMLRTQSQL